MIKKIHIQHAQSSTQHKQVGVGKNSQESRQSAVSFAHVLVEKHFCKKEGICICYRILLSVSTYTHLLVRIPFVEKHVVTGEYGNSHLGSSWLPWKLL